MELPARIGKYELQEFLGGGMSHVYKAQDTVLGRTVAVKILTESGSADPETKARFLQEARMAGNFSHDNIINVFDFGEEQGRPFIIMEFLRGETLKDAIKGSRTGDLQKKLDIALQLARALEYIHTKKIVHRDIKPDNVHLDTAGRVKLMDFGIAKSQNVALTRVGFTLGTPYYMAPEQVLGQQVTTLVDVYAWGIMMFEMLTGMKPVSGESIDKVFQQVLNEPLNLDPLRARGVPDSLVDLIRRCTAKSALERPSGFNVICGELERMMEGTGQPLLGQTGSQPARGYPASGVPSSTSGMPSVSTSGFGSPAGRAPTPAPPQSSQVLPSQPVAPTSQPYSPPPSGRSSPQLSQPQLSQSPAAPPMPQHGAPSRPSSRATPTPAPVSAPTPSAPPMSAPPTNASRGSAPMDGLPEWIKALPPQFRTQGWFTILSAAGVLLGMIAIVLILRLVMRLVF
ncbi:MAG: protein kinase [Bryobacterales bacterium]|nr:protein kinase [Bryobacterales bacterium]